MKACVKVATRAPTVSMAAWADESAAARRQSSDVDDAHVAVAQSAASTADWVESTTA